MGVISSFLDGVMFGAELEHESLTMFPVRTGSESGVAYLSLAEAMGSGLARVSEVSEGGSVPNLLLENSASLPVLIVDGEELVGAKQNRVANLTILVPAKTTTKIPVSCVEAGRWKYSRKGFAASDRVHFSTGRAARARSVSVSLCRDRGPVSDQGRVWRDISAKAARMQAPSPTNAMAAIFEHNHRHLGAYVDALSVNGDHCGGIFAIASTVAGLDIFDEPSTFRAMLPKLVRSYAVDAMEHTGRNGRGCSKKTAKTFLGELGAADEKSYPAVGLGKAVRLTGPGLVGGALVVEGQLVHLAAFATPGTEAGGEDDDSRPTMARTLFRRRMYEDN